MRLSQMNTEDGLDTLVELVPYINEIATDEDLLNEIADKVEIPAGAPVYAKYQAAAGKLNKIAPILLRKKRNATLSIIAICEGIDPEELKKQNIMVTIRTLISILSDKELMSFFGSLGEPDPGR